MLLSELFEPSNNEKESIYEVKIAWARQGGHIVRKFRCSSGPRAGRIVKSPADCGKPLDLKRRQRFKNTRRRQGVRAARRARVTKRHDPRSIEIRRLNRNERMR